MDYIDEILITFVRPHWPRKENKRQIVVDFFSAHLIRTLTYVQFSVRPIALCGVNFAFFFVRWGNLFKTH